MYNFNIDYWIQPGIKWRSGDSYSWAERTGCARFATPLTLDKNGVDLAHSSYSAFVGPTASSVPTDGMLWTVQCFNKLWTVTI